MKALKLLSMDLKSKKVLIIGEPSLVLTCGWLMLNGPLFYDKSESNSNAFMEKRAKKCCRCCEICKKRGSMPLKTEDSEPKTKANYTEVMKTKKKQQPEVIEKLKPCDCHCVCFGEYRNSGFSCWKKSNVILPFFKEEEVLLIVNKKKVKEKKLKGDALRLFQQVINILIIFYVGRGGGGK